MVRESGLIRTRKAWRRRSLGSGLLAAALLLMAAAPAQAQSHGVLDRVDLLARYTVESAVCPKLGFRVDVDAEAFAAAFRAEARTQGLDSAIAERLYTEALARRTRTFQLDLDAVRARAVGEGGLRDEIKPFFVRQGELCVAAATDPIFGRLVTRPLGFDLDRAATAAADSLLVAGGMASWQTPRIQARGDLLMVAGACRRQLGAARSDALLKEFGHADDARERAYYAEAFQLGLDDTELDLDAQQCERALRGFRAKASAPGS